MTLERLRADMSRAAQLPGVTNIWTMPIINRIDMLTTGVRSEVGVKIFGSDLTVLEDSRGKSAELVRTVPGAANVYPEPLTSGQYLNIRVDREAAARYGSQRRARPGDDSSTRSARRTSARRSKDAGGFRSACGIAGARIAPTPRRSATSPVGRRRRQAGAAARRWRRSSMRAGPR